MRDENKHKQVRKLIKYVKYKVNNTNKINDKLYNRGNKKEKQKMKAKIRLIL